jgi:hypothetical protein
MHAPAWVKNLAATLDSDFLGKISRARETTPEIGANRFKGA